MHPPWWRTARRALTLDSTIRARELPALPAATASWCIFDDTASGAALANALALMAIVDA
jgi:hypothetical protein